MLGSNLAEELAVGLEGSLGEDGRLPEFGGQVAVGLSEGMESSLNEVTHSLGVTSGGGVHIIDTSHGDELLGDGGGDDTSTSGSGDKSYSD